MHMFIFIPELIKIIYNGTTYKRVDPGVSGSRSGALDKLKTSVEKISGRLKNY